MPRHFHRFRELRGTNGHVQRIYIYIYRATARAHDARTNARSRTPRNEPRRRLQVTIGACTDATLSHLAFDGASKRNKPNLVVGDVVFGRVVLATKDMEPQISCEAREGQKTFDWVTGKSVYGPLKGIGADEDEAGVREDTERTSDRRKTAPAYTSTVLRCSLRLARRLREPDCVILHVLGASVPFEIVVGVNGVVWIQTQNVVSTIVVANAIRNSEHLDAANHRKQCELMVRRLMNNARSKITRSS